MAITLTGSGGFFTTAGKGVFALNTLNTARKTTVPDEVDDFIVELRNHPDVIDFAIVNRQIGNATRGWQTAGGSISIKSTITNLLIQMVEDDNPQPDSSLRTALLELVRQIESAGDFVDANVVTAVPSAGGSNAGNGTVIASTLRGDGRSQGNIQAEDVVSSFSGTAFQYRGEEREADRLSPFFPLGTGLNTSLTASLPGTGFLVNSSFETADDSEATLPQGWVLSVGVPGTTIELGDFEVQTLTVTGPPTAGSYTISWSNPAGDVQTTLPLAFDAPASTVQTELRKLVGLGSVTVTSTGATPNFTHTITFIGQGGNLNQITVTENTVSGVYTPATVTAGELGFVGRALEFDADGAELTTIQQLLAGLPAETPIAFSGAFAADVSPAAGVLTIDLVDGIGGTVINDSEGTANSFTIDATALTSAFALKTGVFRLPRVVPDLVYLRIRITTAVSAGTSVFVDHVTFVQMQQLYNDDRGPFVAAFEGSVPFVDEDTFDIVTTNDGAGQWQEFINRLFEQDDILLPTSGGGSNIPDSLIS